MKATPKVFIAVFAVALVATAAYAAVLLTEPFAYPDGDLVGNGNWVAHSSGGNKPVQVVSGVAQYEQSPNSGEDVNTQFAAQPEDATTFACFDITIPSTGPLGPANVGDDPIYVAHLKVPAPSFFYNGRVWVQPAQENGNFRFGLTSTSGTFSNIVSWPVDSFFDVTYKVAVSYDAATGDAKLWVDPADENDTSITQNGFSGNAIGEFGLRQASPAGIGASYYCLVDNIKVAQAFHEACDTPVQIDDTTWGQVKGIYR